MQHEDKIKFSNKRLVNYWTIKNINEKKEAIQRAQLDTKKRNKKVALFFSRR